MTKENQQQIIAEMRTLLEKAEYSIEKEFNSSLFFELEQLTQLSVQLTKQAYQKVMEAKNNGSNY